MKSFIQMKWVLLIVASTTTTSVRGELDCTNLRLGQFTCEVPPVLNATQEYAGCDKSRLVKLKCRPLAHLRCQLSTGELKTFNGSELCDELEKTEPCRWTNGKSYMTSCLLSLFFGVFGIDRFYLGYPVLGVIKLTTVGMLGIGALSDFLLILLQKVGPSDGSDLILPYYGFRVNYMWSDESTTLLETTQATTSMGAIFLLTFLLGSLIMAFMAHHGLFCFTTKN